MTPSDPGAEPALQAALFWTHRDAAELLLSRTARVDNTITSLWASACPAGLATSLMIGAIGGYGRRELFPYSDVDLLIVPTSEENLSAVKASLATFLSSLWDSGLRISHSTHTVADCCRLHPDNFELHVSLLDFRFVCGNSDLADQLQARLPETYERHRPALLSRLIKQARQRHAKFNNTPYHLEPNVKESPGGIRDIHLLRWLTQLQPAHEFLREAMLGLQGDEARAKEWLFALRCFLHLRSGRDANTLTFETQDEAARLLPPSPMPPEEWMRLYFHHARRVYQRSLRAIEFAEVRGASRLREFLDRKKDTWNQLPTADFTIRKNRVYLNSPSELFHSGSALLRLFSFVGKCGVPLSWDAQWSIQQESEVVADTFRQTPARWDDWSSLLSQPYTGLALAEMQETGALAASLPPWSSIDSLVVRDFYHRYTVDEHTLLAIREIDRLAAKPDAPGRFEKLAREDGPSPELRLALLLHDIGKGTTPGDHLRGSRKAAREVMATMNAPPASCEAVQFLIRHHLDLSMLMNGRDLEDPGTARLLTSEINTLENLRRLTLLTFADISAVNPTAMSPWRIEQLWRVYSLGVRQLTRELASDRIHEGPPGFQDGRSPQLLEFLEGFPKRYIRTHPRETIARHLELALQARREGVAVQIEEESGTYLLTVVAHDRSGIFAALCGVLASFGMNIVKGEASSNSSRYILDTVRFTDPNRTLALNPEEIVRLQATVKQVVAGAAQAADLLKRRRPVRRPTNESSIAPSVRFIDGASEEATIIDFVGEDRPGLLYDLATAISAANCNIEVVMIDTEAHKAIDVFYVTHDGHTLTAQLQEELKSRLLATAASTN